MIIVIFDSKSDQLLTINHVLYLGDHEARLLKCLATSPNIGNKHMKR